MSESVCFLIKFSRPRRFLHHYFIREHCDFSVFGFSFVCLSICLCACLHACVSMYLRVLSDKRAFNQTLEFLLSLIMCDLMMHRALLSSLKHKRSFCSSLPPPPLFPHAHSAPEVKLFKLFTRRLIERRVRKIRGREEN